MFGRMIPLEVFKSRGSDPLSGKSQISRLTTQADIDQTPSKLCFNETGMQIIWHEILKLTSYVDCVSVSLGYESSQTFFEWMQRGR